MDFWVQTTEGAFLIQGESAKGGIIARFCPHESTHVIGYQALGTSEPKQKVNVYLTAGDTLELRYDTQELDRELDCEVTPAGYKYPASINKPIESSPELSFDLDPLHDGYYYNGEIPDSQ